MHCLLLVALQVAAVATDALRTGTVSYILET